MFTQIIPTVTAPWLRQIKLAAGIAVAALMFTGGYTARGYTADRDLATAKAVLSDRVAQHALDSAAAVEAALVAEREVRAAEQALNQRVQETAREDRTRKAPARHLAAARARAAAAGLRDAAQAPTNAATANPAAGDPDDAERRATALAADLLQARGLLAQCGERLADLAVFADASHAAGQVCERGWDAMTSTTGEAR